MYIQLHKLEEEKASLLYELSDLETTHIDGHDTVHKLKASQRRLLEDLANREGAGTLLQKKLKVHLPIIYLHLKSSYPLPKKKTFESKSHMMSSF